MSKNPLGQATFLHLFGEWTNWDRSKPLPKAFSQWTALGTVQSVPKLLSGSLMAVLEFSEGYLGTFPDPASALRAVADGEFDSELPAPAAELGISKRVSDWNGFK